MTPGGIGGRGAAMGFGKDRSVVGHRLHRGTARRVARYGRPFLGSIAASVALIVLGAAAATAVPLALRVIIDHGVVPDRRDVVIRWALVVAGLAVAQAVIALASRWFSARIGEGLIYLLRSEVFDHVLRQPIAFFTRTQTGALVSRLNTDIIGAQSAFTSTLTGLVSNAVSIALILAAMLSMSWRLTLASLLLLPLFLVPARLAGRRLAALSRQQMTANAELGSRMTERFNVAGALLVKLFGRPEEELRGYQDRARVVRDLGVRIAVNRMGFMTGLTLIAALATALVYGVGGLEVIAGHLSLGTLVALVALLAQLYPPLTQLANVRVDIMTALVSFERVFEVMDLPPLVVDPVRPQPLPEGPLSVELDRVTFHYPAPEEVSLASLEGVAREQSLGGQDVLHDVTLHVEPGRLLALVGPSGAGKTTVTSLVTRLYDSSAGTVRLGGIDVRDVAQADLHARVGMVTQEAHMFHDSIRANLLYARPDAAEAELWQALEAAQVARLVESLPEGLDTVVGDRGHRLSGGEKQRLAIARLLLKSPGLIVLDEATAHLDSESEAAVQHALDRALTGRTAIVIAHRLSTVRNADLIAVVADGRVVQTGTHEELLRKGGLYAQLHRTQFRGAD